MTPMTDPSIIAQRHLSQARARTKARDEARAQAQLEGPSLADVDELCAEFGFHCDDHGESIYILRDMITAAITRWPLPALQPPAQPVNLAELHDPDFSGGLTPSQHLDVVHGGADPRVAAALAEAILSHPGFGDCHDGPVALPAQGEVAELVAALKADAECVAADKPDLMQLTDKQLARIAELLKVLPALLAPGFQIGPQEYILNA
jgi:hypothetical protein